MNLIVAVDEKWNIGYKGNLLERIPADMKQFREKTTGKIVVMGRKTLESFPDQKPLPYRTNIVLTRQKSYDGKGSIILHSYDELFDELKKYKRDDIFVIGGGEVYRSLLRYCHTAYITKFHNTYEADTTFPNLDKDINWTLISQEGSFFHRNDLKYSYLVYKNREPLDYLI